MTPGGVPLSVLVVPDKFKGTISAPRAARAIASGWSRARPRDSLQLVPMSDGGDGFGPVIALQSGGSRRRLGAVDAAGRTIGVSWWWLEESNRAVIESARVVGLARLPPKRFHPFDLDTRGLGLVLGRLCRRGIGRFLIGLGGSATNDGGFGMAQALGWRFLGKGDRPLLRWPELEALRKVMPPPPDGSRPAPEVCIAIDVNNPLLGREGASRIYGPQKGLIGREIDRAEACLARLSECMERLTGRNDALREGAGAAGGLGFGAFAFLDAAALSGYEVFAESARLEERIGEADLILTGEGRIDSSSLMGKGVGEIVSRCRAGNKPCLVLAGQACGFGNEAGVHAMVPEVATLEEALDHPRRCLSRLAQAVARDWSQTPRPDLQIR